MARRDVAAANQLGSMRHPVDANPYRPAVTTYYRVAIAAGKTITFPHPRRQQQHDLLGTDGGLHNFLRFLEDWNGDTLVLQRLAGESLLLHLQHGNVQMLQLRGL